VQVVRIGGGWRYGAIALLAGLAGAGITYLLG
jgi:hypothetical protein